MCVPMYVTCQVVYAVCVFYVLYVHYTVYVCCTCLYVCTRVCKVVSKLSLDLETLIETRTVKLYKVSVLYTIHFVHVVYPWMPKAKVSYINTHAGIVK